MAMSCLIVDDSEEFLASATRLLESQGVEIVGRASTGAEAQELVRNLGPDVVLVDIELGEEDGIELVGTLKAESTSTSFVLISSHDRDEIAELIADSGAVGFLGKHALGASAIAGLVR
jgi:DNA-binding NarL/FixJ family response regulator